MSSDSSDNESENWGPEMESIEERLNQGSGHRRNILGAFKAATERELNTSVLRQRADVPSGSMNHHLETLERWGVIEDTEERQYPQGGGRPARVWRLTEMGEEFIEKTDDGLQPPQTAETAERVTALENRVKELEDQLEEQEKIKKAFVLLAEKSDAMSEENVDEMRDLLSVEN